MDKHGGRPGSVFPKPSGSPLNKNMQGQYYLENIITHPKSNITHWQHQNFGKITDIEASGQGGVRFS